ncbi:MAG: redoxin family protein [Lewinellaceae bacterium]|nr:redoxin family protein [Lewinellaceae bacterium]
MKTPISTIFLAFSFCSFLSAQPAAPDFTVTDSQGQAHHLYADYLNQNKTVVLELFFTYCPPCNSIAPLVEPLYQSWGGGSAEVEFISLSIKNDDTSTDVAIFKANYGHTFPGVGADGGSLPACLPYQNGTYGLFFGTPTFVVIAPDGSVNFDPRGPNQSATIDSVDVAIAATGAARPPVAFTVGGSVNTPQGDPINGVAVNLLEISGSTGTSGPTGQYSFNTQLEYDQLYTLQAQKTGGSRNGVSTHDLLLISRHILGVAPFNNPLQVIASDANRDSKVTTLDLIYLRRLILGIDTELNGQESWIFINPDYQFQNPADPFPEAYSGDAGKVFFSVQGYAPSNWIGLKIGDVNDSADGSQ